MKAAPPAASELFDPQSVTAPPRLPRPDRDVYQNSCRCRWHGDALRDALGNWSHFEQHRDQLIAGMVQFQAGDHRALGEFLWAFQQQVQPDLSRLDPYVDFCEHYQKVHLRRGLVYYCQQILDGLRENTSSKTII